jgi:hypothetical protein
VEDTGLNHARVSIIQSSNGSEVGRDVGGYGLDFEGRTHRAGSWIEEDGGKQRKK